MLKWSSSNWPLKCNKGILCNWILLVPFMEISHYELPFYSFEILFFTLSIYGLFEFSIVPIRNVNLRSKNYLSEEQIVESISFQLEWISIKMDYTCQIWFMSLGISGNPNIGLVWLSIILFTLLSWLNVSPILRTQF